MRRVYLLVALTLLNFSVFATTWYSSPAGGDPSVLTNWWDSPTGSGANPTTFTTSSDVFTVQSTMVMTAATWTVGGAVIFNSGSVELEPATTGTIIFNNTVTMNNSTYIWSGYAGRGGGATGTVYLYFYSPLTMNDNSSIDGDPSVNGGPINVYLYSDMSMSGTAFVNNQSMSNSALTYVYFANAASSSASPQHLSGTGSQVGSAYTYWYVNGGAHVQLVDSFNTEPPVAGGGFGGPTYYPFTINAGGFLDFQVYDFNGTGNIVVSNGGTLLTANTAGINGSIQCTGTNTLNAGGSYVFNGTSPQVTGTLLPATISAGTNGGGGGPGGGTYYSGSLKIENAAGVTLSQNTTMGVLTVGGGFGPSTYYASMLNDSLGNLYLANYNLIIGAAGTTFAPTTATLTATPAGFSSTNKIVTSGTGQLQIQYGAAGNVLFPVGDASNYTPITIDLTTTPTVGTSYIGVNVAGVKDPHNANANNYLNRYWGIYSNIGGVAYTVSSAQYVVGDVVGSESAMSAGKYYRALPWVKYGAANTVTHTLTTGAVTITSDTAEFTGITTAGPAFTITPSESVCSGVPATLQVLTSTVDAPATYVWTPSTGLSSTHGTLVTATPSVTTTYSVTVTDGNGFTSSNTVTLTVNPNPGPITGAGSQVLCLGQTLSLGDTSSSGTWGSSDPSSGSVDAFGNVTASGNGTPTISYTLTGGCAADVTLTIVSTPGSIAGSSIVCTGANTTLTDIGAGTWSSSNTAQATINPTSGALYGVAPGTSSITYTLAPGCVTSETVDVDAAPAAITGPANACIGISAALSDPTPGGIWSSSNDTFATVSASGGVTGVASGSVVIFYTDPLTGCYAAYPMGVVELPPAITGTTTVCAGFSSMLADGIAGGTWSSGNPALATVDPTTGLVTGIAAGSPTIYYTLLPGCFTAVPFVVNASGTPTVGITVAPGTTICPGTLAHFSVASSTFTGASPVYDWVKDGIYVATGTTYNYVPADGDVVYSVLHSDFACRRIDSASSSHITLSTTAVTTPTVSISAVYGTIGADMDDTLIAVIVGVTPAPTYQWYKNDLPIPGATSSYYVINTDSVGAAAYNCVVNSGNACNSTGISNRLTITVTNVGVKQVSAETAELSIMPNPNHGSFTLKVTANADEAVHVVISNLLGETVQQLTTSTNIATPINLNMPAGVYLLIADTGNGRYVTRIIVN